jgi:hypothetical protein
MATRRPRWLAGLAAAAALAIVVVVAACGQAPAPTGSRPAPSAPSTPLALDPSEPGGQPIVVEGRDAGFALTLRIGSDAVDAGAPIDVAAVLAWEGADQRASIWGSGGGPVSFGLEQVDGDIRIDAVMTADCAQHEYTRGVPVAIPFRKSGGFPDDDPNADFYRAFFADPVLRLPAGRWRVRATASGYLVPCEMDAPMVTIPLEAEILVL